MSGQQWYAVVDTAQHDGLVHLVRSCAQHVCLFSGKLTPDLAATAPYLVLIDEREQLIHEWRQHGKNGNWGILLLSELPIEQLRKHLRRFLQVKLPDGAICLFRFFDPRVFPTYITAATADEQEPWFTGISRYYIEAKDEDPRDFRMLHGQLHDGQQVAA